MVKCCSCNLDILNFCYIVSKSKVACASCVNNVCYKCNDPFASKYHTLVNSCSRMGESVVKSIVPKIIVCDSCNHDIVNSTVSRLAH